MSPTPFTANTLDLSAVSGIDDPVITQLRERGRTTTLDLTAGYAQYVPQRPGGYLRLSMHDINEDRRARKEATKRKTAIERQTEDVEAKRQALEWGPFVKLYIDDDTSAYKKKRITRPDGTVDWVVLRKDFQQMLKDLLNGVIDGIVFYDLDRLVRQPRDLEDLANVVDEVKRPAIGATSELNLVRESDCNMARVMCVMLLKQSQDTARRVARDTLGAAEMGIPIGRLGYGWVRKGENVGTKIEKEAAVVRRIFRELVEKNGNPSSITRGLTLSGIPSPGGGEWTTATVKLILSNPRYAGMVLYSGRHRLEPSKQHVGMSKLLTDEKGNPVMGTWDEIVSPQTWFKAQSILKARQEQNGVDSTPVGGHEYGKYLLTGVVRCYKCEKPMEGRWNGQAKYHVYRCPSRGRNGACGSTSRKMKPIDDLIDILMEEFLIEKLGASLSETVQEDEEITEQRMELEEQRNEAITEKEQLKGKWERGELSDVGWSNEDYYEHVGAISKKIRDLIEKLEALGSAPDPQAVESDLALWRSGDNVEKRVIIKRYMKYIQLLKGPKGRGKFDPETVVPIWRETKGHRAGQTSEEATEEASVPQ
ncbi:recombinase family protein [Streptomyces sp. NA02950]|uniref:recombinase family protein n=1 Tax=Streptomyces sp. NA02950 TaxID=2742137 RepID=UPI001591B1D9|nr:recombinase family protein [Streptomyces sp. NA02950]QKV94717.1 recombinase family protein [Streptomyces sp. NA02950]